VTNRVRRVLLAAYVAAIGATGYAAGAGRFGGDVDKIFRYARPALALLAVAGAIVFATELAVSLRKLGSCGRHGNILAIYSRDRLRRARKHWTRYPIERICAVERVQAGPLVFVFWAIVWLTVFALAARVYAPAAFAVAIAAAIHFWILSCVAIRVITSQSRVDEYLARRGGADELANLVRGDGVTIALSGLLTSREVIVLGSRLVRAASARRVSIFWFVVAVIAGASTYVAKHRVGDAVTAMLPWAVLGIVNLFRTRTECHFTSGAAVALPGDHLGVLAPMLAHFVTMRARPAAVASDDALIVARKAPMAAPPSTTPADVIDGDADATGKRVAVAAMTTEDFALRSPRRWLVPTGVGGGVAVAVAILVIAVARGKHRDDDVQHARSPGFDTTAIRRDWRQPETTDLERGIEENARPRVEQIRRATAASSAQLQPATVAAPIEPATVEPSVETLLDAELAALRTIDTAALGELLRGARFAFGVDAEEVASDAPGAIAQVRHDLGSPPRRGFTITSHHRAIGRAERTAWITEELEVARGKTRRRFALSQLAQLVDNTWHVVAWHWSVAVPNDVAREVADAGAFPAPAPPRCTGSASPDVTRAATTAFGSLAQLRAAIDVRSETVNIGSAPGERVTGGKHVVRVFGAMQATIALRDACSFDVDPELAVTAANVDYTVAWRGKDIVETFRVLAVWLREPRGWRIVQTHWSNGGPVPDPGTLSVAAAPKTSADDPAPDDNTTTPPPASEPPEPAPAEPTQPGDEAPAAEPASE
jgi:SnoaL-like protein